VAHVDDADAGIDATVEKLEDVITTQGEEQLHTVGAEAVRHEAATVHGRAGTADAVLAHGGHCTGRGG
jgi:hypothetical protein